ncbi:hypothetical protein Pcinc_014421 [Petrolisthes cinctipes]|uniref:Uncharacterized protein n=1 Tax=Petrolisthes cinctipes TaxID=88211 RepID=A0AAE1FXV2_PETCI|nr:hypothetical protein Pcinc_014421 [Petrolisthes cinctipes]
MPLCLNTWLEYPSLGFCSLLAVAAVRLIARHTCGIYIMRMPPVTRLFFGGLNNTVDEEALHSQLSSYGAVCNIDFKEKTDFDGNVVVKFAYVNIEADHFQIEECMRHFNGSSELGEQVRVEPAKESFLDRLKRERASQPPYQPATRPPDRPRKEQSYTFTADAPKLSEKKSNKEGKLSLTTKGVPLEVTRSEKKKSVRYTEVSQDEEEATPVPEKKKKRSKEEGSSENSTEASPTFKEQCKPSINVEEEITSSPKKKYTAEKEILSSFQNFSSVWADSDSEENGEATSTSAWKKHKKARIAVSTDNDPENYVNNDDFAGSSSEVQLERQEQSDKTDKYSGNSTNQPITRYDPTCPDHQKFKIVASQKNEQFPSAAEPNKETYIKVTKGLKFRDQASSGFSFLAQFSQQRQESQDREEDTVPSYTAHDTREEKEEPPVPAMVQSRSVMPPQYKTKNRPFFVAADDPIIDDAINWMAQSITDDIKEEFSTIQPELRDLFRSRVQIAKRDLRDSRVDTHQDPKMDVCCTLAFFLAILCLASAENTHKRFEYKYSFKGPYLAQKDNQVPFWQYSGNAIASEESVRITPSLRSQKGQIWTKNPTNFEWWEVDFVFRVTGRGRIGADGLALWFSDKPGVEGPVFGSSDQWNGLGVFFDSFDNDNKRNNPYIMAMVNDGTKVYDHENDGMSQQLGGCLRDFRNKPFPVRAKIEYYKNVLTVRTQNLEYDYIKLKEEGEEDPGVGGYSPSVSGEATVSSQSEGGEMQATAAPPFTEEGYTRESPQMGHLIQEDTHDVAEEELSGGWGWFSADLSHPPDTLSPTQETPAPTQAKKRRRSKKQRKDRRRGGGKPKKSKKKRVIVTPVGIPT